VTNRGVHRTTPNSTAGRRMTGAKGAMLVDPGKSTLTQEQIEWNRKIEEKRLARKSRTR
jgi:hypothetical protein